MSLRSHLREQRHLYLVELLSRHRGDRAAVCREARISQATLYRILPRIVSDLHPARTFPPPVSEGAEKLLVYFGVSEKELRVRQPNWARIYDTARTNYRSVSKALHPDVPSAWGTGSTPAKRLERFLAVNEAWRKVEAFLVRRAAPNARKAA